MKLRLSLFFFFLLIFVSESTFGQRFAYVDLEYVMSQMPEYDEAQAELNKLTTSWTSEVSQKQQAIRAAYDKYKAEEVLLTETMRGRRQEAITKLEVELKAYQTEVFGPNGTLFLKRIELLNAVRKTVSEAVEIVARKNRYQMVLDKSAGLTLIYTDPLYDLTQKVLEELGLVEPEDDASANN